MQARKKSSVWCGVLGALLCTGAGFAQFGSNSVSDGIPEPTRENPFDVASNHKEQFRHLTITVKDHEGKIINDAVVAGVTPDGALKATGGTTHYTMACPDTKLTLCVVRNETDAEVAIDLGRHLFLDVTLMIEADGTLSAKVRPVNVGDKIVDGIAVATSVGGGGETCATAEPISGAGTYAFDSTGSTTDGPSNCGLLGADVWFALSDCEGDVTVSTCDNAGHDTAMSAYDSCGGALLDCNDDDCSLQSTVAFTGVAGTTYLIQVGGFNGASGAGSIVVTCSGPGGGGGCGDCDQPDPGGAPGCSDPTCEGIVCGADAFCCNTTWDQICADAAAAACDCAPVGGDLCDADLCADADAISGEGTFTYDNSAATTDGLEDILCDAFGSQQIDNDIWCCWTAACDGLVTVQTCGGTADDTKIAVYDGCACPTGPALACNDDTCALQSLVQFNAVAGNQYLIRIGNFPGVVGQTGGSFSISCPPVDLPCELTNCQNFATDNASQSNDTAFRSADDFFAPVAGSVTELCWWGAYLPDISGDGFFVTYYDDNAGVPGSVVGGPFAQPFTLGVSGPADTGSLVAGIAPIWEYSGTHAGVGLDANTCYWLEVKNDPETSTWFWEWSFDGNNRVVVDAGPDGYGPEDIAQGNDFAWCLDADVDFGCVVIVDGNGLCSDATPISGEGAFPFDNLFAGTDGPEDVLCDAFGSLQVESDVWFCWTAPCTGSVRFETCGQTAVDTKIAVYDGCSCPPGPALACNDDESCGLQSGLQFDAVAGNQYLLRVGVFPGASGGAGTFSLTCISTPDNEDCEDAETIGIGELVLGTTQFASPSEAPACDGAGAAGGGGNVWYQVIGDGTTLSASTCPENLSDCCFANGSPGCDDFECEAIVCGADAFCCDTEWDGICAAAAADLCGGLCSTATDFDTQISVYCDDCDDLVCVAGNDDDCGLQSTATWCSQNGASYVILVHGFAGSEGNFQLTVSSDYAYCTGAVACIPVGACCIGSDCVDGLTEDACTDAGGSEWFEGQACQGGFDGYAVFAGGPFVDISNTGIEAPSASNSDDGGDVIALPFTFCFFENFYDTVGVCSNGYLTFGNDLSDFTNDPIPDPIDPNDLIAPYWDDWSPNQGGTVVYEDMGDHFLVQWTGVPHFAGTGPSTFQAALYANGDIEYRYGSLSPNSPTVGVENSTGTAGTDSTGVEPESIRYVKLLTDQVVCIVGACCYDGGCVVTTEDECLTLPNGNFLGVGTDCIPDDIADPGLYHLFNDPDNAQAPPGYGLRLDELFDATIDHDVITFDFEHAGSEMYLCYDALDDEVRVWGRARGGVDRGLGHDPDFVFWAEIDMTYNDVSVGNLVNGGDSLLVDGPNGANGGTVTVVGNDCCVANGGLGCEDLACAAQVCSDDPFCCLSSWDQDYADAAADLCFDCSGEVFTIFDYAGSNPFTFIFGPNDPIGFEGNGPNPLRGQGWLVQPDPDSAYILSNDWAFIGVPTDDPGINGTTPPTQSMGDDAPALRTPAPQSGLRSSSTGR